MFETIGVFVVKGIASFALNKGLEALLESFKDLDEFESELLTVIRRSVSIFKEKYPIETEKTKFPFYDSKVLLEYMLKFRLFNEETLDEVALNKELEQNPNIQVPTGEQLYNFLDIFSGEVAKHEKLKVFEIEQTYKERIFIIDQKLNRIIDSFQLKLIEVGPLLQDEYKAEIEECYIEIKSLKFRTALDRLLTIEERIDRNAEHVSEKLRADLFFYKALCFESLEEEKNANESFILAYRKFPNYIKYKSRACLAYYKLGDKKYLDLKKEIEEIDDYNIEVWYIDLQVSTDKLNFLLNQVPENVLNEPRYKRIVFNYNLRCQFIDFDQLTQKLGFHLDGNLPDVINYDNVYHWLFILNVVSIIYFKEEPIMYSITPIREDFKWKYFYDLSTLISNTILDSQFTTAFNRIHFLRYWMELESGKGGLEKLFDTYEELPNKDSFITFLMANSIQKYDNLQKGIEFIESKKDLIDYNLVLLKIFCQIMVPGIPVDIKDAFTYATVIDSFCVNQICRYIEPILKINRISFDEVLELIQNAKYSNENYKELLLLLVNCTKDENDISVDEILSLSEKLKFEPELNEHIAFILFENENYKECVDYIKMYLDETKPSQSLITYIEALNSHRKEKQIELLRVLELWRRNFIFNSRFLRMEIELRQIIDDIQSIYQISKYALETLPDDESFFVFYIFSLNVLSFDDELQGQILKIKSFKFKRTEHALNIIRVLLLKGYYQESLDILYEKALNPNDGLARMVYFNSTLNYPREFFVDFDIVSEGTYVRFEINGESQLKLIKSNSGDQFIENSIGKSKGEVFSVKALHSNLMKTVRIVRIMNKYLALFDQVCIDAESSFSNLPIEPIKFEKDDVKEFEKKFIELFGQDQQNHKKQFDDTLNEYNRYLISFTEFGMRNFKGNFIDTYLYLTSPKSQGFLTFPIQLLNKDFDFDNSKIVLDFTSALLFFQLEKELNLVFQEYVVPKSFIHIVDKIIFDAKESSRSKMTVHVVGNNVIPTFFSDDYHQNRIMSLEDFLEWIKLHTKQITPAEKIDIIRPLYDEGKIDLQFECGIDIAFLGQREGYIILSDDLLYRKILPVISNKIVSPEMYLIEKFPEKKKEIYEYLLKQKYVGLSIDGRVLYDAYITQNKKGYEHIFQYAIRSITFKQTFTSYHIETIVDFLKEIAINPLITEEKYVHDATNVLLMTIKSFSNSKQLNYLQFLINQKFKLTGKYLNLTLGSLYYAIRIFNPNIDID